MRTTLRKVMVPAVVVMAVTAGCSSDSGAGEEGRQGASADDVCGGFAKDAPSSAALKAIAGDGNFTSDLSEPDEVLKALRDAALMEQSAKKRMQGIAFCWLLPTEDGKSGLRIEFREALGVPERDARLEETVTYFLSGERASSSDVGAKVFFKCRMKAPAHEIVIAAELQRSDRIEAPQKDIRAHQITLANAAARKVAVELGCQGTQLTNGVPRPLPDVPHR